MNYQVKENVVASAFALVPILVVLLATKPALRQAIVMRVSHTGRVFCQSQADFWQTLAIGCAQTYNNARL